MPMFSKGIILTQHKEPALSAPILRFVTPATDKLGITNTRVAAGSEGEAIMEVCRLAKIADERDGRTLSGKLRAAAGKAVCVVADAVDDEPFVSSRLGPLLAYPQQAVSGLALCARALGIPGATKIMAYKMITDTQTKIPRKIENIKVQKVRGGYPKQGQLESPGQLTVGVGALIHLARAAESRKIQSTTFVTVAGNCVSTPVNVEVSLGITVGQLLDRCGLGSQPTRVVSGGSMRGFALIDPERTIINHTTRAVLAFREDERHMRYNCIGCGECERVCPVGLNPMYIRKYQAGGLWAKLEPFDPHHCTGCGTCSYICPSKLEVADAVARGKEYMLGELAALGEPMEEEDD